MHPEDQEKSSFIREKDTYCYKVISFGLKNAGTTYQRLVNRIFNYEIGKLIEVYVDDIFVKRPSVKTHIEDLA